MTDIDDTSGDRLRRLLREEAATMTPSDEGLERIREKAAEEPSAARRWAPLVAAAAVLLAVGAALLFWPRGGTGQTAGPVASASGGSSASTSPSGTTEPTLAPRAVAAYVVGSSEGRSRLYREFAQSTVADPVQAAVNTMLSTPADPDYSTPWPAGTTATVQRSGAAVQVSLSADPSGQADLAVQQVVYTVTGADTAVTAVTVETPAATYPNQVRAPGVDVIAPVWLLSPTQGATVTSPVKLSGTAAVFEATVNWDILGADGTVVKQGYATATVGAPDRGDWSASVVLTAGSYEARAFMLSPQDGRMQWIDSKTFTVK